jgi:hypothetical protein
MPDLPNCFPNDAFFFLALKLLEQKNYLSMFVNFISLSRAQDLEDESKSYE